MKAKLVTITLIARVVVSDNATDEEIVEASRSEFLEKVRDQSLGENLESIEDDTECPFDPEFEEPISQDVIARYRAVYLMYLQENRLADDSHMITVDDLISFVDDNIDDEDFLTYGGDLSIRITPNPA